MTAKQENMDDKKDKINKDETEKEENPKAAIDSQADTTTSPPNQRANQPSGSSGQINAVQPAPILDRHDITYSRVSQPTSFESLCTRILDDWPDEEDILPPVADFSIENMLPGWYQSLCASPHCHGDL